jgi:hypothetical protein
MHTTNVINVRFEYMWYAESVCACECW